MSAVAERSAPARSRPVPRHAMAATAVEHLEQPAQAAAFWGHHVLLTHCGLFGEVIEPGDVISVNFDVRGITCDSEYLIAFNCGQGHQWFCVRRFARMLDGSMQMAAPDDTGRPVWGVCPRHILDTITVYGQVLEIYKPVSKTRCRHG